LLKIDAALFIEMWRINSSKRSTFVKRLLAAVLCLLFPMANLASEAGYAVKYDGGSLGDVKTGTDLRLVMTGNEIQLLHKHEVVKAIPASAVTEISYGQDVHRRVGEPNGAAVAA